MAQLHPKSYELPPIEFGARDWRETAHEKAFEKLQKTHDMIKFSVADGYAWYIVKSRKPLVLQHVDYSDGYRASTPLIRGLRLSDINDKIRYNKTS